MASRTTFHDLPPELRFLIYEYALADFTKPDPYVLTRASLGTLSRLFRADNYLGTDAMQLSVPFALPTYAGLIRLYMMIG